MYKNFIIYFFFKGYEYCVDLDFEKIKEIKYNELFINWYSFDGEEVFYVLCVFKGVVYYISDKVMCEMSSLFDCKEGKKILFVFIAGLIGLLCLYEENLLENDCFVVVFIVCY